MHVVMPAHACAHSFLLLCRALNNLHLHLSLGIPGFMAPEFLVEDVSYAPLGTGRCMGLQNAARRLHNIETPAPLPVLKALFHQTRNAAEPP